MKNHEIIHSETTVRFPFLESYRPLRLLYKKIPYFSGSGFPLFLTGILSGISFRLLRSLSYRSIFSGWNLEWGVHTDWIVPGRRQGRLRTERKNNLFIPVIGEDESVSFHSDESTYSNEQNNGSGNEKRLGTEGGFETSRDILSCGRDRVGTPEIRITPSLKNRSSVVQPSFFSFFRPFRGVGKETGEDSVLSFLPRINPVIISREEATGRKRSDFNVALPEECVQQEVSRSVCSSVSLTHGHGSGRIMGHGLPDDLSSRKQTSFFRADAGCHFLTFPSISRIFRKEYLECDRAVFPEDTKSVSQHQRQGDDRQTFLRMPVASSNNFWKYDSGNQAKLTSGYHPERVDPRRNESDMPMITNHIHSLVDHFEIHTTNLEADLDQVRDQIVGVLQHAVNDFKIGGN